MEAKVKNGSQLVTVLTELQQAVEKCQHQQNQTCRIPYVDTINIVLVKVRSCKPNYSINRWP